MYFNLWNIFHWFYTSQTQTSLSLTLQHFLSLAGFVTWPRDSHNPLLNYVQDNTVSLTIAQSGADFNRLSSNYFLTAKDYHPLIPQLAMSSEQAAVLALQITVFPDRGFSIGIIKDPMGLETIYSNNWLNFGGSNNRSWMFWEPGSIFTRLSSRYLSIRSSKNTLLEGMWNCEEYNRFRISSSVNIFSNMCLYMHGFA